jgi:hypothetical protein
MLSPDQALLGIQVAKINSRKARSGAQESAWGTWLV